MPNLHDTAGFILVIKNTETSNSNETLTECMHFNFYLRWVYSTAQTPNYMYFVRLFVYFSYTALQL